MLPLLAPILGLSFPSGVEILLILIVLGFLIFWIKTIVEIARSRFKNDTSQIIWVLVVAFCGIVGLILYYAIGRKDRIGPQTRI